MPVIARFQFRPDRAKEFCWGESEFVEQQFENPDEIIAFCKEFESALAGVTANVNGQIVSLLPEGAEPQ